MPKITPQNAKNTLQFLSLPVLIPDKNKKINSNSYFHTLCGALKGFEAPQRSVKIKI